MPYYFINPQTPEGFYFIDPFFETVTIAPEFVSTVTINEITSSSFNINYKLNIDGNVHWLVVNNAATPPTPAQIRAGLDYGSETVLATLSKQVIANQTYILKIENLTNLQGANLIAYGIAETSNNTLQDAAEMQILPVTLKKLVANDITIYWDINTVPINFDTDRLMVINADTKVMTITN